MAMRALIPMAFPFSSTIPLMLDFSVWPQGFVAFGRCIVGAVILSAMHL